MNRLLPFLLFVLALPAAAQSPCGGAVTVESGDTLAEIAARCATSLDAILEANPDITNPNVIAVGQVIDLPAAGDRSPVAERRPGPERPDQDRRDRTPTGHDGGDRDAARSSGRTYTVRSGDTLAEIAARFGVSVAAMLAANANIADPARLEIGWDLRIPDDPQPRYSTDLDVSADRAAPGETVRLRASGFPARARVLVGVGPPDSEYRVVRRGLRANADGDLTASAALPTGDAPGGEWVFVVATDDHRLKAISDPVAVVRGDRDRDDQPGDGRLVVRGQLTDEGVECPALRAQDGRLYTLAGDTGRFGPGDHVRAEGTVAEVSTCMQGTTLALDRLMTWKGADDRSDGGTLRQVHRIEGTLVHATECPGVRTDNGELFTLAGGGDRYEPGTRVRVEGVEAEVSYCQEGTTLAVREIEPAR